MLVADIFLWTLRCYLNIQSPQSCLQSEAQVELSFTLFELKQIEYRWMTNKTSSHMLLLTNSTIGLLAISNGALKVLAAEAQRRIHRGHGAFNPKVPEVHMDLSS